MPRLLPRETMQPPARVYGRLGMWPAPQSGEPCRRSTSGQVTNDIGVSNGCDWRDV